MHSYSIHASELLSLLFGNTRISLEGIMMLLILTFLFMSGIVVHKKVRSFCTINICTAPLNKNTCMLCMCFVVKLYFALCINILILCKHALFSWATQHTTLGLDCKWIAILTMMSKWFVRLTKSELIYPEVVLWGWLLVSIAIHAIIQTRTVLEQCLIQISLTFTGFTAEGNLVEGYGTRNQCDNNSVDSQCCRWKGNIELSLISWWVDKKSIRCNLSSVTFLNKR